MLIFLILFVIILSTTSCASVPIKERSSQYNYYKEKLKGVDRSDGISRQEAIIIAQNYLIEEGWDKDYIITRPTVEELDFGTEWEVIFKATYSESIRRANIFGLVGIFKWWICVHIDKKTGEVITVGGPDL
jgi:hypothetical protein